MCWVQEYQVNWKTILGKLFVSVFCVIKLICKQIKVLIQTFDVLKQQTMHRILLIVSSL